ncbi:MAG: FtsQ-type POTRA domain-containing protein [Chloroflexota bacterium]
MKRKTTISKPSKLKGQRSKTRLGENAVLLETSVSTSPLSIQPAMAYWNANRGRILGLSLAVLLVWIAYLVFTLPDFYIYEANIHGNRVLTQAEIYEAADIDTLSAFWVNPAQVKANIEALPNIKTADIFLTLPANLTIAVQEREATIIWRSGTETWWVDEEGLCVPPRGEIEQGTEKLEIIDLDERPIQANDRVDISIVQGAQIIHKLKPDLQALQYRQQHGLIYETAESWPVYLGRAQNLEAKIQVADAMRVDLLTRQVTPAFIDVRNPLRIVYRE